MANKPIHEKWLDELEIEPDNVDTETASALGVHIVRGGLPTMPGLIELPLKNSELSAMVSLVDGLNEIREKCGLEKVAISPDRLHIIETEQFRQEIGQVNGFEMLGHAYVPESQRNQGELFAYSLSHEMAHLSSFVSVWVQLAGQGKQARVAQVLQKRTGLQRLGDSGQPEFTGLNEAVTEYLALLIRREVSAGLGPFAKQCGATATKLMAYTGMSKLMIALSRQLAAAQVKPEWTNPTLVWKDLLIDYWTGSDTYLDLLQQIHPDVYTDLKHLGVKYADAEAVAQKHGLQLTNQG